MGEASSAGYLREVRKSRQGRAAIATPHACQTGTRAFYGKSQQYRRPRTSREQLAIAGAPECRRAVYHGRRRQRCQRTRANRLQKMPIFFPGRTDAFWGLRICHFDSRPIVAFACAVFAKNAKCSLHRSDFYMAKWPPSPITAVLPASTMDLVDEAQSQFCDKVGSPRRLFTSRLALPAVF